MKRTGTTITRTETNAWGADCTVSRTVFIIQDCDVGLHMPNHMGLNYKSHLMTRADVGKHIEMLDHGAWYFTGGRENTRHTLPSISPRERQLVHLRYAIAVALLVASFGVWVLR